MQRDITRTFWAERRRCGSDNSTIALNATLDVPPLPRASVLDAVAAVARRVQHVFVAVVVSLGDSWRPWGRRTASL
jgi:hypothetical protein